VDAIAKVEKNTHRRQEVLVGLHEDQSEMLTSEHPGKRIFACHRKSLQVSTFVIF